MKNLKKRFLIVVAIFLICLCFQSNTLSQDRRALAEQAAAEAMKLRGERTAEGTRSAIKKYEEALAIWRELGDKTNEASTLKTIGVMYQQLNETEKSIDYLNQAITLARSIGSPDIESESLLSMGQDYIVLGDPRDSFNAYTQALALAREAKNQELEVIALISLGYAYDEFGNKQSAIDYYNQSLPLLRAMKNTAGEASVSINIGTVYLSLGESRRAIDFYLAALPIIRQSGDTDTEATLLNNLGAGYQDLGEKQKAVDFYTQGMLLNKKIGDRYGEAIALSNVAGAFDELGEQSKALELLNQALTIQREMKSRSTEATTLSNIGRLYYSQKDYQKSFEFYSLALTLRRDVGDIFGESATLYNLARTERERGNINEARSLIDAAIRIIESVRASLASEELKASYFAKIQDYYKFQINLMMQLHAKQPDQGFDALALQTSERARARGLLDILSEVRTSIRQGIEAPLLERERDLQKQLNAKADERRRSKDAQQAETMDKEIQTLVTAYQDLQAEIKQKSPHYAELTQPKLANLKEIQQMLDADTILLEYSLGSEGSSYLWVVSNSSIKSFALPKREDIETKAREFYELVKTPESIERVRPAASDLSKMLLDPAAAELGNKRLIIIPDGSLQYMPFAALPDPKFKTQNPNSTETPLMVDHEIVYLPSASTLAVIRNDANGRKSAPKTLAVIADPVFDANDVRINTGTAKEPAKNETTNPALDKATRDGSFTLPRLPGTRREALEILSLVAEPEKKQAMDFEASRQTVTSPELANYRIIHFATHGLLNSRHPELSGIVLSLVDERGNPQDGFLRLHEIYNLKLPADLIVLSACQTALGKNVKGEGLIGLTRGFMYAGAQRIVASLWSVDDRATSELMKKFYQGILGEKKLRPAAALREAQIAMWKNKRFSAPYFWSTFTLQGEWR